MIIIIIIILIILILILSFLDTKEWWDNVTKPPKGWIQHNNIRIKLK